jgi:hypothetical protein
MVDTGPRTCPWDISHQIYSSSESNSASLKMSDKNIILSAASRGHTFLQWRDEREEKERANGSTSQEE